MKALSGILIVLLLVAPQAAGENAVESNALESQPVEFENHLIPVFTKIGCNAGGCHGAAVGRGGFKLSLYGGNPRADFEAIVQRVAGRRVNLANPEESLIILKPTFGIDHEGKFLMDDDDEGTLLLLRWIKEGALFVSNRRLQRVEVTPTRDFSEALNSVVQLRAIAHYSDGTSRDVTKWTVFTAEDSSSVEVDAKTGESKVLRRGRHIVVARYLTEVVPIELIVPLSEDAIELAAEPRHSFIDEEILDSLKTLRLPPSTSINDAAFLRRVTLDLTGRIPSPEHVEMFVANGAETKRQALVDELLESEEFTEHWARQLAEWLRIEPQRDQKAVQTYEAWLAEQIRTKVSYRQLARTLITASGDTHEVGPASFYRTTPGPGEQAEFFSELFMGSRLRCANCHNHPLDSWTQDDYHGLANIFAKVDSGKVIRSNPGGEVIHPVTSEPAISRIPGESAQVNSDEAIRQLADWLTADENPYFAKTVVNRLWERMMGRGLVEPIDDFRSTNPATHPALLDKLAEDFAANGYLLRHTLRTIANSATYARSPNANEENKNDDRFYSYAFRRPLDSVVLAHAITDVLGLANEDTKTPPADAGALPQMLHMFNGSLLNARIAAEGSRLSQMLAAGQSPQEVIDDFYLVALGRRPTSDEKQYWEQLLASVTDSTALLEDVVWGLLASDEFSTNH
ncbi:MAG TPA: DUF1553 domain-containing protein [Gammaproteobacteria bacterium]|nr:DUF1553 domain-containing protein [Gammaproteobacteria bacterium]